MSSDEQPRRTSRPAAPTTPRAGPAAPPGAPRRGRGWWATGAAALAALVGLAVVAGGGGGGSGASDPDAFDLPALEGDGRVRLAEFAGRPVVVNFFASWCTSCDFELPGFARVSEELRGKVTFVGVNSLETGDRTAMPERHGITWWPLARDIGARGNALHAALGGRGMPITAFYDASGMLVHVEPGALDEPALRGKIRSLFSVEV